MSETANAKRTGAGAGSAPQADQPVSEKPGGEKPGKAKAAAETVREGAGDAYAQARDRAADAYVSAMESSAALFRSARDQGTATIEAALDAADQARERAARQLENNPLVALAGGLVIGVMAGALLPRTQAESRAFGEIGGKLSDAARVAASEAVDAAKSAGRESLGDMMMGGDAVSTAVTRLIDAAFAAATSAGSAALRSTRDSGTTH